jgi:hypothetical protein
MHAEINYKKLLVPSGANESEIFVSSAANETDLSSGESESDFSSGANESEILTRTSCNQYLSNLME